MSKLEKVNQSDAQGTTAELPSGAISTNRRAELMSKVAQSNETNLDLAERVYELLDDITLGVSQKEMSAEDVVEYIEEYIEHELELLIFKLENEIK